MKLRPVLLVILLLSGFYYATTHMASSGTLAPWLHRALAPVADGAHEANGSTGGPLDLTEASAAPAYDTEELQNIAVYKKALPSVVNITSTAVAVRLLLRTGSAAGSGIRLHPQQRRPHPD